MEKLFKKMLDLTPKQKVLAGIAVVLLVCLLVAIGFLLTMDTEKDEGKGTNVEVTENSGVEEGTAVDDSTVKDEVNNEDEEVVKPNKENTTTSNNITKPIADSSTSTTKPSTNTGSGNTSTTPSKPSTGGSTTPSKPSEPEKPVHSHDWVAQYKEVDNGYYEEVVVGYNTYTKCGGCGINLSTVGNVGAHMKEHYLNGTYCNSYEVSEPIKEKQWVPVIEKELVGYKCSGCGSIK